MAVLRRLVSSDRSDVQMLFWCPGCKRNHTFRIKGSGPIWTWNGDMNSPTFSPSLLVDKSNPETRCHSFVRNGKIEFLSDCHHDLRTKTVQLPHINEDWDPVGAE